MNLIFVQNIDSDVDEDDCDNNESKRFVSMYQPAGLN